jgi:predicted AAA+ superfamily ATPase
MKIVTRLAAARLAQLLRRSPAVAILGPRQCGKTTLVRTLFPSSQIFDLERPSDVQRLEADPEYVLANSKGAVVLDEAHRMPELFPILRALIDDRRGENGRFILLGSAHPSLVRGISESLAGRIMFLELDPFCYLEVLKSRITLADLWLRGGLPVPCLRPGRRDWMDGYVRTFLERDLAGIGVDLSMPQIRRFWQMLAYAQGWFWNASDFGRSLGMSYHTVNRYADVLEQAFLLRRLQPYSANLKKRLVRRPRVYLTDSGLVHSFLGIQTHRQLSVSPHRGATWEGFMIEQIIRREKLTDPTSQFYYYRTSAGAELDLLIVRGTRRIGIEIKLGTRVEPAAMRTLRALKAELDLDLTLLINQGGAAYTATPGVKVIPARELLSSRDWKF